MTTPATPPITKGSGIHEDHIDRPSGGCACHGVACGLRFHYGRTSGPSRHCPMREGLQGESGPGRLTQHHADLQRHPRDHGFPRAKPSEPTLEPELVPFTFGSLDWELNTTSVTAPFGKSCAPVAVQGNDHQGPDRVSSFSPSRHRATTSGRIPRCHVFRCPRVPGWC